MIFDFTLVDSIQKKITALQNIMEKVDVSNVAVIATGRKICKAGGNTNEAYDRGDCQGSSVLE